MVLSNMFSLFPLLMIMVMVMVVVVMLVKMMLSPDDLKTWPHHPSSLHHPPCHATAPRVGLLYRVMALVQDSIYHDATDFCGREGSPEDGLAPIKVASRASGLLKDDKGRIWCRRQNG